ncbi:OXA-294 family class D beta-lactamase [Acinetobacter vivianii]|uniref:OXA-294 family class D beta-lactamase n=1 Tax=Acinetobacter vivianii TaxID=1776742 RepID=UPI002DBAC8FD|nr:OXA-294 family class D beta-lactamase [Acinetobacter vivianii]MEB6479812.1 OXA-294 family class D beta-lactamase [Acinetobacter vivianii]MEB6658426.1 OXA-294 family class D beta-lactamase [Acinetobacter vivianii]
MSKKLKLLALCATVISAATLVGCQNIQSQAQPLALKKQAQDQIAIAFENIQTTGVLVTYDGKNFQKYGNDLSRADQRYIPASTFKMLNALIGIQHHKTSPNEVFKWDGQKRAFRSWEKDLTLAEAMQASAVPVYQELARRIGLELMASEVKRVGYGNQNIGAQVDNFWLVGPLEITPVEEVKFAYALAKQQLPFDPSTQQQVRDMLLIENVQGTRIYAKSGWGMDVHPQVGWWTGWVEQPNGQVTAFSLNMEMKKAEHADARKAIVYQALQQLGLLPQ